MRTAPLLREAVGFHVLFGLATAALLWLMPASSYGLALLLAALLYNLGLPLFSLMRGHVDWLLLWLFLLPLSCAQLLADWALVDLAGTLVFPDHGVYRVGGAVPLYFIGLWVMLLFPITLIADHAGHMRYAVAGLLGLLLFAFWEWAAAPLALWQAQNVRTLDGMALYPLIPEALLAMSSLWMYRLTRSHGLFASVCGSLMVSVFYTGALFLSLLLFRHHG